MIKKYNGAGVERGVAASSHVKTGEASLHTSVVKVLLLLLLLMGRISRVDSA